MESLKEKILDEEDENSKEVYQEKCKELLEIRAMLKEKSEDPLIIIKDQLSEVTRKERKFLLLFSVIAFIVIRLGIIPTKINALGIEFTLTNQNNLFLILALILAYFLFAFIIYSFSDYLKWKIEAKKSSESLFNYKPLDLSGKINSRKIDSEYKILDTAIKEFEEYHLIYYFKSRVTFRTRRFFDYIIPILIGILVLIETLTLYFK